MQAWNLEYLCTGHGFQDSEQNLRFRDPAASTKPNFTETNEGPSFLVKHMKTNVGGSLSSYPLGGTGK